MKNKSPQFVSTAKAAEMLGLSTTLIQSLVDKNELQGWKTTGGHRRISIRSIEDYQSKASTPGAKALRSHAPTVLVAVDSIQMADKLEKKAKEWAFPVKLIFIHSVSEALLILGAERPDLLVVELTMPQAQQETTLLALENFNAKGRPVSMVLLTSVEGLRIRPSLISRHIQLVPGPLSETWLHAYLTGVAASCRN